MKRIVSDVAIERLWTDLLTVIEIGVRDPIALVDVILGQVAAPNQTHMKRIDEKPSLIVKRITGRLAQQILCSLLAVEVIAETVILTDPIVVAAKKL